MKLKFIQLTDSDYNGRMFGIDFEKGITVCSISDDFLNKMEGVSGFERGKDYKIIEVELIEKYKYDQLLNENEYLQRKLEKKNKNANLSIEV